MNEKKGKKKVWRKKKVKEGACALPEKGMWHFQTCVFTFHKTKCITAFFNLSFVWDDSVVVFVVSFLR